jgi:ABC-type antimicrobial peptide transport system permease subunit
VATHPLVALAEEKTLASHVRDLTAAQRMSAIATLTLALLGIVMLAAGCVSLFVSMVRDSVREIAIRMALGATTGRLTRRVLTQGAVVTLAGMTVGLVAARAVAVRIADRLHGVSAWDPFTWVSALALIALVSLASVYAAAVLAARTDPARLLRAE